MNVNKFLSTGINRREYLKLFVFGLILAPIVFIFALYLALYIDNAFGNEMISMAIALSSFVLIGIYFYIIKIKRLRDIGDENGSLLGAHMLPIGDVALNAILFGKQSKSLADTTMNSKTSPEFFQTQSGKFIIFLIFVNLQLLYVIFFKYLTGEPLYTFSTLAEPIELLKIAFSFFFVPYIYAGFFRSIFNWYSLHFHNARKEILTRKEFILIASIIILIYFFYLSLYLVLLNVTK